MIVLLLFRLLSKKKAAQVFSNMDIKTQSQLVELFSEKELESLIEINIWMIL